MAISFPSMLGEALQWMGTKFPGTDEGAVKSAGGELSSAAAVANTESNDMKGAVAHVQSANEGDALNRFVAYMNGQSNISGSAALSKALEAAAKGHKSAATRVMTLKVAIIAAAAVVQVLINKYKAASDPYSKAALFALAFAAAKIAGAAMKALDSGAAAAVRKG